MSSFHISVFNRNSDIGENIYQISYSFLIKNEKLNTVALGILKQIQNGFYKDGEFFVALANSQKGLLRILDGD